ncbi:ABC transporter permease [Paenibacillus athensensis]|uniref:Putative hemin transport system permease protein HrtB n=1 Tax=Paenibacillus athensensis TaxID=1967502 RepID=A0A4Y8PPY7_9BACL|nr:ABC transporter permease [Paenibacillus athensensis]MCD1261672.1 ABC transporter permease [Paenibacillus athensensis]
MYLALREMRFAKARYSLIATILLLVAFLVLFVTGLAQGLAYDNAASIQNMTATHFMMEKAADHHFTRSRVSGQQAAQAGAAAGANNVQPLGVRMTTVTAGGAAGKLDVTLLAVEPDGWLMPTVTEGAKLAADSAGQVVVDDKLKASGVGIGTVLTDQASGRQWTVSGFVSRESFSHSPAVWMSERDWRALQAASAGSARAGATASAAGEAAAGATAGVADVAADAAAAGVKGGAASVAADDAADAAIYNALAVKTDDAGAKRLAAALPTLEAVSKAAAVAAIPGYKEEQGSLLMMRVFLFVISAFVLAVFFYVITIQKSHLFGILKAIGTRNAYLARSVVLQVLLLSAGSLLTSLLLVGAMEALLPDGMPFRLQASMLALTCGAFMAMSLAGSLLSLWKVSRIDALDAIGRAAA